MEPLDERAVRTSFVNCSKGEAGRIKLPASFPPGIAWADLSCSLYLRGKRRPKGRLVRSEETVPLEQRIDRAMRNLDAFVSRVAAG
jgi:hypothetical protein